MRTMCKVLDVSESGYYAWLKRPESARLKENLRIGDKVQMVFAQSKKRYGSIRITKELQGNGEKCNKKRVARLMKERGLKAKAARKFRATTDSSHTYPVANNDLNREFEASAPNKKWVGDITYLWCDEGWMYLAVFIDLYSRKVVGWALSTRLTTDLVLLAFERACASRRPGEDLLVHTDRGIQYAANRFREKLKAAGAMLSMSRKGNCWDNAVVESFFHSFKVEAIHGERFRSRSELEYEVFDYIERFYNTWRRHSTLGYQSPMNYEKLTNNRERLAA